MAAAAAAVVAAVAVMVAALAVEVAAAAAGAKAPSLLAAGRPGRQAGRQAGLLDLSSLPRPLPPPPFRHPFSGTLELPHWALHRTPTTSTELFSISVWISVRVRFWPRGEGVH